MTKGMVALHDVTQAPQRMALGTKKVPHVTNHAPSASISTSTFTFTITITIKIGLPSFVSPAGLEIKSMSRVFSKSGVFKRLV
jgi:hypothetical protein